MKKLLLLLLLIPNICFANFYWTNVDDYGNPPHYDNGMEAKSCSLRYFKYVKDIQDWYVEQQNKIAYNKNSTRDTRRHVRIQRSRLLYEMLKRKRK